MDHPAASPDQQTYSVIKSPGDPLVDRLVQKMKSVKLRPTSQITSREDRSGREWRITILRRHARGT